MKRKPHAKPRRTASATPKRAQSPPDLDLTPEELAHWKTWLAKEYKRPRSPRPNPKALNQTTVRTLQILFRLLHLSPCQIEKHTTVTHQHQRKLRLAAAGQTDLHLSLHTLLLITNGLRINLPRLLRHLLNRLNLCAPLLLETLPA